MTHVLMCGLCGRTWEECEKDICPYRSLANAVQRLLNVGREPTQAAPKPLAAGEEEWSDLYAEGGVRRGVRCKSYITKWGAQCMNTEGHTVKHRYTSGADGASVSWTDEEATKNV